MWPHQFTIALGDVAVGIGTDDDQLATTLAPARIEPGELLDPERVDFGMEWHPARPARGVPRSLPTNQHGSSVIGRATDLAALRDGLLRTLADAAAPTPPGCVRLTGLPLLRDGAVELVSPDDIGQLSHRRLVARGYSPTYVPSVLIAPGTLTVHIAAPWGTDAPPTVAPLRTWWAQLPAGEAGHALTLGQTVAHVAHRIAQPMIEPPTVPTGADAELAALVHLVQQLPPTLGSMNG